MKRYKLSESKRSPWIQGKEAFWAGADITANPFPDKTDNWHDWLEGYVEAEVDQALEHDMELDEKENGQ